MSPNQRAEHDAARVDYDARRGPDSVHTRDTQGRLLIDGVLENADGGGAADGEIQAPKPTAGERIKVGEVEFSEAELIDLAAHKAAQDSRLASLPATPDGYELKLPAELKLPVGVEFQINPADPVLAQVRAFAHANQLSQEQFSSLFGLHAASKAAELAAINEAAASERAKLGPAITARIDAIDRWIRSQFGEAAAKPMMATMVTAIQVETFERIMQKISNPGGSVFTQQHRVVEPATVDDATWSQWSYSQKKEYAEAATARSGRR
jgi:hypothetical protein